jgi:hypothetical protein
VVIFNTYYKNKISNLLVLRRRGRGGGGLQFFYGELAILTYTIIASKLEILFTWQCGTTIGLTKIFSFALQVKSISFGLLQGGGE